MNLGKVSRWINLWCLPVGILLIPEPSEHFWNQPCVNRMGQKEQVDPRKKVWYCRWVLEDVGPRGEITVMVFRKTALRYDMDTPELPILWQLIIILDWTTFLGSSSRFSISTQGHKDFASFSPPSSSTCRHSPACGDLLERNHYSFLFLLHLWLALQIQLNSIPRAHPLTAAFYFPHTLVFIRKDEGTEKLENK